MTRRPVPHRVGLSSRSRENVPPGGLPVVRIGVAGGVVGILCCVGPASLAIMGVVGAATAFAWATDLYEGYTWWFRLLGLAVMATLVWVWLRRQRRCNVVFDGRSLWWRLAGVLGIAVATYAVLYAVTTWLGGFA